MDAQGDFQESGLSLAMLVSAFLLSCGGGTAASALALVLLTGCGEGLVVSGGEVQPVKYVDSAGFIQEPGHFVLKEFRGPIGAQLGLRCDYPGTFPEKPAGINVLSKAEIDWGDGSGFQDVTSDAFNKWHKAGATSDPAYLSVHSYTSEGRFIVTSRLTYWDGTEVLEPIQDRPIINVGRYTITLTYGTTPLDFEQGVGIGPPGTQLGARMSFLSSLPGAPGPDLADEITKFEIDWGEGAGFEDVTSDALTKWFIQPEGAEDDDPAWLTVHTFNTPGEYTISGRVTYWDGVVVTEDESTRSKLRITP